MRYAPVAMCLLALCLATVAEANHNFTVVLHAKTVAGTGLCTLAPNCVDTQPRTSVAPNEEFRLYVVVNNYNQMQAFQTCLLWPDPSTGWLLDPDGEAPATFACTPNPLVGHDVSGDGEGPNGTNDVDGSYLVSFDCVTGPAAAPIVRVDFRAGTSGCLRQINPQQGSGRVEIDDCAVNPPGGNPTLRDASTADGQLYLGQVCVAPSPGYNACQPPVAVEPATWGKIKATYNN